MTKPLWLRADERRRTEVDGWVELVRLVPAAPDQVPQYAGLGASGDWFLTQGRASGHEFEDLTISRFDADGVLLGAMRVPEGGHGDRMIMRGDEIGVYVQAVWCWLPWDGGKTWTIEQAHEHEGTRRRLDLAARRYCQGEVDLGETWLRLYGGSIKPPPHDDAHPQATVEVIRGDAIEQVIKVDRLAYDEQGLPMEGRLEPEGIIAAELAGDPWILVGFAIGRLGHTSHVVYGRTTRSLVDVPDLLHDGQ